MYNPVHFRRPKILAGTVRPSDANVLNLAHCAQTEVETAVILGNKARLTQDRLCLSPDLIFNGD
jgi:hypothetical protein